MEWIYNLLCDKDSVAHIVLIYAFTIALGVRLGKIKILGVSLGVTFVLFVGLLMGHFQLSVNADVLHFVREFGLILFIFSIGMQVGPSFFSSFKQGGMLLNGLAIMIIALNIAVALGIYFGFGNISVTSIVGVLSGAVTNTPGLGAAQQTLIEVQGANEATTAAMQDMSMGYAAAYPLGVIGIILSMILLKVIFKINTDTEAEAIANDNEQSQLKPYLVTFCVENKFINGKTIQKVHEIIDRNFVISRIKKASGEIVIPKSSTILEIGDLLYTVISVQDIDTYTAVIGPQKDVNWEEITPEDVVSRRVLITNSAYNGRKLGSLRLRYGYGLNATRVNRAGVDLLARPNLTLQVGDRITVVGRVDDIDRLATKMGNSMKRLNEPNMVTLFIGIFLGIIVGSIPLNFPGMTVPMRLGLAGGPLVVAILISRFGYKIHLVTYTSSSANLLLREIGICLFLASVGLASGERFAETVFNSTGLTWVAYGFAITFIPLMIVGVVARWKFKLNYFTILGLISGGTTDPPALAYSNKVASNDAPAVAYSTVYPLTMFLRVITAQIIVLALA